MEERNREQKQAKMEDQSSSMENLPSHILTEIISRLPIKTVMAIRCVCKTLLSLVSDSHFQVQHSTRAPTELCYNGWTESSTTLYTAEYVFLDDSLTAVDEKKNSVVFELPNFSVGYHNNCNFGATATRVTFVNSCCGLVCFRGPYGNKFAVVCNPFTREYITFPCPARTDKTIETQGICYGLGFSAKDNSFKLLRLFCRKKVGTDYVDEKIRLVGEIYTFGERVSSWKRVANSPDLYLSSLGMRTVLFIEGVLYWYCTLSDDAIVTFDFDTKLFGKLVSPPRLCDKSNSKVQWYSAAGVFENCLCISGYENVGDCVDIWALKDYGQGSWIKIFSIQSDVTHFGKGCERFKYVRKGESYEPFKYLQNGEVLMFKNFGGIVCFNPDTGSVKNVDGQCHRNRAVFIRPSLVSLKVLLGDNVKVHSVKPWDCKKAATIPRWWTSSVAVKDVVKADKDTQGCVQGSSRPTSSLEASTSTSHPTEEKVKEDVLPAILESQQGGADAGSFGSQDPRPPKDRWFSATQTILHGIESLKDENERKGKVIETLSAENERQGKVIAKLKQRKKKDHAVMRFMHQQMLNANLNMSACPIPDDSSSSDDSD